MGAFPAELEDGTLVEIESKGYDLNYNEVFTATNGSKYTRVNAVGTLVEYDEALGEPKDAGNPDAEAEGEQLSDPALVTEPPVEPASETQTDGETQTEDETQPAA